MELTSRHIKQLKKEAHHLEPIFQIGKNGINNNFITQVDEALNKRELIKISILQNAAEDKETLARTIESGTNSHIVTIIGNTIVVYRESKEHKRIELE